LQSLKSLNSLLVSDKAGDSMSETTIGLSSKLKKRLIKLKKHEKESYEDVIWRLVKKK
jgi:hypothetical protein